MPDERKYGDEEIRQIFDRASRRDEVRGAESVGEPGLTLSELQDVGREVGLEPESVAAAAAELERKGIPLPSRKLLGQQLSVGRVAELPRALSDREWERLVTELRSTFGAKGRVASTGSLREWSNGNLQALVEPTSTGYRLRLHTVKRSALSARFLGRVALGLAAFTALIFALQGRTEEIASVPLVFAVLGGAALASPLLTLRAWARERERQMEHILRWTIELTGD